MQQVGDGTWDEQEGRGTGSILDPRRRDGGTQFRLVR